MQHIISGKVIKGDGYGKKLGFPTVNLEIGDQIPLEAGVYAGSVILDEKKYRAGIVIGPEDKVEAHILGYNGNAYGKIVTLEINKFLRNYQKFESEKELINQIKKDLNLC